MSVTFDDIKKANDTIRTTDIKGKAYAEVSERIRAFRMVYPTGKIITEMVSNENGVCVFRATVYGDSINVISTGTAFEKDGSNFINQTSYIENCETSAVGRALGFAGFGINHGVASADEVLNAQQNQIANEKIDEIKVNALEQRCANDGVTVDALCNLYKVKTLSDLNNKQYVNIHENWDKISLMGKEKNEQG